MANRNAYHDEGPVIVGGPRAAATQRNDQGPRMPRAYFCRECQTQQMALYIPEGWYTLTRQVPSTKFPQYNSTRIGHFCSAACLTGHLGRINSIEAKRDGEQS